MKRSLSFLLAVFFMLCFAACAPETYTAPKGNAALSENAVSEDENHMSPAESGGVSDETQASSMENKESVSENSENQKEETEEGLEMKPNMFYVTVGGNTFTASFADNSGAQALKELLRNGPITVDMSDYGGFEKVGSLGRNLPTSNTQTTTQPGDIVLYQGNQIVLFYGSNSWSYTRLGKINDLTGWEDALGVGDVSVTFSLTEPQS